MNLSTLCTILVAFGQETAEFTLLTIAPFAAIRQKSAYDAKYLRISWTYLDLLYRFVRRISGMIMQIFVWRSPKGRCYGNQLNSGDVHKRCLERPLLFALVFDNRLADRKSAFKILNGNNQVSSCTNLVNFRSVISPSRLYARLCHAFLVYFFTDCSENNYLRINWTDFHDLFTK